MAKMTTRLVGIICVIFVIGGEAPPTLANAVLDKLLCSIEDPVLELIPPNLAKAAHELLTKTGQECALSACGQPDHLGTFDIYCDLQCKLAFYSGGTCSNNLHEGWAKCTCHGHGQPHLETGILVCELIGNCGCQTCSNGEHPPVKYASGKCLTFSNGTLEVHCKI